MLIYKILPRAEWDAALETGGFRGSAIDLQDGYIHFSTAEQAPETARRYFANISGLVVLAVEADDLGLMLKWEPSRGGDLFPHLYSDLACALVRTIHEAPLDADGVPRMPA